MNDQTMNLDKPMPLTEKTHLGSWIAAAITLFDNASPEQKTVIRLRVDDTLTAHQNFINGGEWHATLKTTEDLLKELN